MTRKFGDRQKDGVVSSEISSAMLVDLKILGQQQTATCFVRYSAVENAGTSLKLDAGGAEKYAWGATCHPEQNDIGC